MKKIIITGVTGQDGSYMADYLLANTDHKIYGGVRRLSVKNHNNIGHLKDEPRFELIDLDVTDPINVTGVIERIRPDYFINLAANSFVGNSWDMPTNHFETNTMAVLSQLEAIRKYAPHCRYYNAGSSEEFGDVDYSPQDEDHPLKPRSPYGASKASARHIVKVYRESYGLYAIQGWLFNHESERRGEEFVTRKITKGVVRIYHALNEKYGYRENGETNLLKLLKPITPIFIGNISARRDWSHAEDFVDGIWKMLNQTVPSPYELREYVLSSNETHSVKEFIETAFAAAGINGVWVFDKFENPVFVKDGVTLVEVDPKFYRPAEVQLLYGDSTAARETLGWQPKVPFEELVRRMVEHDLKEV
jgi:GDPmannose 4,6-dehydratase